MNITILNIKDLIKLAVKIILLILLLIIIGFVCKKNKINISEKAYTKPIDKYISINKCINEEETKEVNSLIFLDIGLGSLNKVALEENEVEVLNTENEEIIEENKDDNNIEANENVTIEKVVERNIEAKYTNSYSSVEINNQSDYELTEEILTPDIELNNKKDIFIYHTHTCESYTPTENYNYEASGNYRTIDLNYSVARVGTELTNYLEEKGFNVQHNTTYHDYPSYSGSYERALGTIQSLLQNLDVEMVIDLHRDAVGDGSSYGPTVKVNDQSVAQLMFVIGTDGGGLEHPNWQQNLKFAVKLQEKANEMYPGLFRPIILRNSRYNQHIRKAACIIEVGATGNTMEECVLSMKYLANVFNEFCK